MTSYELQATSVPIQIGATGLAGLQQCLRTIIKTVVFSVPLDRAFAHKGTFIDSPLPNVTALYIADLIEAIEKNEPRVKVESIRLSNPQASSADLSEGRAYPVIRYRLREGVDL